MCTLTYMPDGEGFALVSSRDEAINRGPMMPPMLHQQDGAIYPVDQRSGGTWFMTSEAGYSLNILNGGFEPHERQLPYRQSRGLVISHFAQFGNADDFVAGYDFVGIEPFTLVVVNHNPRRLNSVVWTGQEAVLTHHDVTEPMIWSSATLFSAAAKAERQKWFYQDVINPKINVEGLDTVDKLLSFHHNGGKNWDNLAERIQMKSDDGKQTVCIAAIAYNSRHWKFIYHDLLSDQQRAISLLG